MLIIMHDAVAVLNTTSGAVLWRHQLEGEHVHEDQAGFYGNPFITDRIAGYQHIRDQDCKIEMYDVNTGKHIGSHVRKGKGNYWMLDNHNMFARGSYVCFSDLILTTHILKIADNGDKIEEFSFRFPREYFSQLTKLSHLLYRLGNIQFIGFLGRSNVLIGRLKEHSRQNNFSIFSLDLDAAVSAKCGEEVRRAFSLPLGPELGVIMPGCDGECFFRSCKKCDSWSIYDYRPIYRTDRITGSLDLVGVMRTTEANEKQTVKSYFFVTEMQCQT